MPIVSNAANAVSMLPRERHRAAAYMSVPSVASVPGDTDKESLYEDS